MVLVAVIAAALGSVAAVVALSMIAAGNYVADLPTLADVREIDQPENSQVYARDRRRLATFAALENRQAVRLDQMSPWLPIATVAVEDRRYYEHDGVDWYAIARAAMIDLRAGEIREGGSTLTQQLIKNQYGDSKRAFDRKIREAWLARLYEQEHTKPQILERYLNIIPFGNAAKGAEAASRTYFNKNASQLTLAEAALLAGLPQAPGDYDPIAHPQAAKARRNDVLLRMFDQGKITQSQYRQAVAAPLGLRKGQPYGRTREAYFVEYVRAELKKTKFKDEIADGGLRVYTTIDRRLQSLALQAMRSVLVKRPCSKREQTVMKVEFQRGNSGVQNPTCDPTAAVVSIRPATGEILAMQTTADFTKDATNLVTTGKRQPGSTFKAITLATAIEQRIDPDATDYVADSPYVCDPPECSEHVEIKGAGGGVKSIAEGVRSSDNVVFFQLALDVGPGNVANMAERLGGIPPDQLVAVPSITLGASSVTPLQMTSVFATLAAGGVYRAPRAIDEVRRRGSKQVSKIRFKGRRVISDGVAAEANRVLGTNMTAGLGTSARVADGRDQIGKSGTTNEHWDAWFCGATPELATCVWLGYPVGQIPMNNVEGVAAVQGPTLPSKIWNAYMTLALRSLPPTRFGEPNDPVDYSDFESPHTQRAVTVEVSTDDPTRGAPTVTVATQTGQGGDPVVTVG